MQAVLELRSFEHFVLTPPRHLYKDTCGVTEGGEKPHVCVTVSVRELADVTTKEDWLSSFEHRDNRVLEV